MKNHYFQTIWKLNENEYFESKETLEQHIADNWENYAYPIGDEKNFLRLTENKFNGIDIIYEVMDYDPETGKPGLWVKETESLDITPLELMCRFDDK